MKALPTAPGGRFGKALFQARMDVAACEIRICSTSALFVASFLNGTALFFSGHPLLLPDCSLPGSDRQIASVRLIRIRLHDSIAIVVSRHPLSRPFSYTHHRHIRTDAD